MKNNSPSFKNHLINIVILVAIFTLFLIPIFHKGVYKSHDGDQLIGGIASMHLALVDGQFPPRWSGTYNYSFGSPHLLFYYPLENYLGSFLHSVGFNFQDVYKILMFFSFVLAPIFFYAWMSQLMSKDSAFFGALLYGLVPYRFVDVFVRGSLGEMFALAIAPLVFFFIQVTIKKPSIKYVVLGALSYGLLILSHNILSLIFSFIFLGYIFIANWSLKKRIISTGLILLLGLAFSAFFWVPALYESKYINSAAFIGAFYKDHFLPFGKIIYSGWGFGDKVNQENGLSPYIGPIHFSLVLIGSTILLKKFRERRILIFWLMVFIVSIFFATSFSRYVWEEVGILKKFEFPWRFVAIGSFTSAVIGTYVLASFKRKVFVYFIFAILLIISIPLAKVSGYFSNSDKFYLSFPFMDFHGESTTIWTAGNASKFPKNPIEIIDGEGLITGVYKKSNEHKFTVDAKNKLKILDNTVYFPGWRVMVDGKKVPIEFQDMNHRGLITFDIPEGKHNVKVTFGETPMRMIADFISLFSLAGISLIIIFRKKINFIK